MQVPGAPRAAAITTAGNSRRRARLARRAAPGPADNTAGHDRRHRRLAARLRPALPAHHQPGAAPLGAAGAGTAPRRSDPADRGLPRRRPVFRQRRPSPGIHSRRDRPADNRRLRDRDTHHRVTQQHNAPPHRRIAAVNAAHTARPEGPPPPQRSPRTDEVSEDWSLTAVPHDRQTRWTRSSQPWPRRSEICRAVSARVADDR